MLRGKVVGLAAVEKEDLGSLKDWRNNAKIRKHFREYRELNTEMQKRWYEQSVRRDRSTMVFSIRRLKDDKLLGCCGFVYINWLHRHADLSLYIGWNGSYIDSKGYAREACSLMLGYGFNELNLNKIWSEVYAFDKKKKKLYDRFGFNVDGVLRQNYFYDGIYHNSYILSLLASDWRNKLSGGKK